MDLIDYHCTGTFANLNAMAHRILQSADLDVCCSSSTACSSLHDVWLLSPTCQCGSSRRKMLAIPLKQRFLQEIKMAAARLA